MPWTDIIGIFIDGANIAIQIILIAGALTCGAVFIILGILTISGR